MTNFWNLFPLKRKTKSGWFSVSPPIGALASFEGFDLCFILTFHRMSLSNTHNRRRQARSLFEHTISPLENLRIYPHNLHPTTQPSTHSHPPTPTEPAFTLGPSDTHTLLRHTRMRAYTRGTSLWCPWACHSFNMAHPKTHPPKPTHTTHTNAHIHTHTGLHIYVHPPMFA